MELSSPLSSAQAVIMNFMIAMFAGPVSNSDPNQTDIPPERSSPNRKKQGIALLAHGQ
jgi:hypothetical protein